MNSVAAENSDAKSYFLNKRWFMKLAVWGFLIVIGNFYFTARFFVAFGNDSLDSLSHLELVAPVGGFLSLWLLFFLVSRLVLREPIIILDGSGIQLKQMFRKDTIPWSNIDEIELAPRNIGAIGWATSPQLHLVYETKGRKAELWIPPQSVDAAAANLKKEFEVLWETCRKSP